MPASCWSTACAAHEAAARQEALLNVGQGQIPNDTGSDGATTMTIEECKELGGKALKVVFAKGDSFGDRQARVANWKPFVSLQFNAFNPAQQKVPLTLTVKHKRTTSYQTRVDFPFTLNPGKNEVKIGIDELANVNGSAPDLSAVGKWYFACAEGAAPTLYFGDIWLVGDDLPAAPAAGGAAAAAGPAPVYHIKRDDRQPRRSISRRRPRARRRPPRRRRGRSAATRPGWPASVPRRCRRSPSPSSSARPRPTPSVRPWRSSRPTTPGTRSFRIGRCTRTRRTSLPRSAQQKPLRYNADMGFILVPPGQPRVEVKIVGYPGESDKGPFPVPGNTPIEGWPGNYQRQRSGKPPTLDDVQRDVLKQDGDRHASVVDPVNRMLYEFYQMKKTDRGWQAAQCSIFDLKSNQLRPDGWTSTDAAGLPIFPATVRYDEIRRGIVEHAMRVTVVKTRRAYVAPATHFASPHEDENLPRMGERIRLKQDFDISGFSPEVQAILKGLKKYGMFVADNGIDWAISVAPDPRIPVLHEELRKIKGSAFEVVVPPQ